MRHSPAKSGKIVTACAAVHNVCILADVENYVPGPNVQLRNRFARRDLAPAEVLPAGRTRRQQLVQLEMLRNARNRN